MPAGEWLGAEAYARVWARSGIDDPYYHPAFLRAGAVAAEGAVAAFAAGDLLYPFVVRELPRGRCDVTSAYGFGGPAGTAAGWRADFRAECARRGVVSEFVRFHPLRANHGGLDDMDVRHVQDMITVDVRLDDAGLIAQMGSQGRRNLRRAERHGVAVRGGLDLARFTPMYGDAMRRLGASPHYLFPPAYFEALAGLGDALVMLDAGEATALYLAGDGAMHYHLGASTEEGRRIGAATAMHVAAMRTARARGLHTLHLGGGMRDGDALQRFKASLGAGRAPYHVGSAVHDAAAYADLCAAAGADPADAYFPAYRAPVSRPSGAGS